MDLPTFKFVAFRRHWIEYRTRDTITERGKITWINYGRVEKIPGLSMDVGGMSGGNSVSGWILGLKGADADAAQQLWNRFYGQLVDIAKQKLQGVPPGMSDEEDIAAGVFQSVCRGAAAGRFEDIKNRDDLWWLLLAITKQKVVNYIRHESAAKRGKGRVRTESALALATASDRFSLDHLVGDAPTPEYLAMLDEESRKLLGLLRDDYLRTIASMRIEGYTIPEIADEIGISQRSVERKLRLIRTTWSQELSDGKSSPDAE